MTSLLAAPLLAAAQTTTAPADLQNPSLSPTPRSHVGAQVKTKKPQPELKPFSRIGLSGGVSAMGINMQAAVNVDRYLNLRGVGNYFNYNLNNQKIDSYTVNGNLHLASGGALLDFYPFPHHGFRLSPGVLFHNENHAGGSFVINGGTDLTLNNTKYYSSASNPITGSGGVVLNNNQPEAVFTTGWGNLISRKGGHWSVPFEVGVVMIGTPGVNVSLTGGQACDSNGANCVNVATDATVQANLQSQIAKYKNDLNDLKFYPVLSLGIGYNFRIR
jgi:hypothetical protein